MSDPDLIEERRQAFNKFLRLEGGRMKFYRLPSQDITMVHDMMRKSFMAGARYERKLQEPTQVGGRD